MENPRSRRAERAALVSLLVTVCLVGLKFAVWAATSSLAVLSQALDSVLDIVTLGLVFLAVRLAGKPADETHHYGHGKAENLAAFAQTFFVGLVALGVAVEAISRIVNDSGTPSAPWYAVALLVASIVVDGARVAFLLSTATALRSDALRAGALNIAGDLASAAIVLVSLLSVRAGAGHADEIGAIIVTVVVGAAAINLARRSIDVLMDRAPAASRAIKAAAEATSGVEEARRVRVRSSGDKLFADVTVAAGRTQSLERVHDIAEQVEKEIERVAPGTDVVVHVEPARDTSSLVERVQAAASRTPDVYEVHNVLVHAFDDGTTQKLHVTLHAKVRPGLSVKDAHDLADRIESAISSEVATSAPVRVDAHIEPLRPTAFGRDVTHERRDLVRDVERAALQEADILDCHEVIVTSTDSELSIVAHVRGRADLPLSRMHDASERIENRLHGLHPDLGEVLIHFEPR